MYHIAVSVAGQETWRVRRMALDGAEQPCATPRLHDDGRGHHVRVEVGGRLHRRVSLLGT